MSNIIYDARVAVGQGSTTYYRLPSGDPPTGFVLYEGNLYFDDDGRLSMVWDDVIQTIRQKTNDEILTEAVETSRRVIKEAIDSSTGKVLVALVKVLIDQGVIAATPAQVRTAIENKIAAGEVD